MRSSIAVGTLVGVFISTVPLCIRPLHAQVVWIDIGDASGAAGEEVRVSVSLDSNRQAVVATQNDILFAPALVDLEKASECRINPEISALTEECQDDPESGACKDLLRDLGDCPGREGCPKLCAGGNNGGDLCISDRYCPGSVCIADPAFDGYRRFRAVILSLDNFNAIDPTGGVIELYRCTFRVSEGVSGSGILRNLNVGVSDAAGNPLDVGGRDGEVSIVGALTPTATVTPTSLTKTPRDTPTPTETPTPADTPQPTDTPRPTAVGGRMIDVSYVSGIRGETVALDVTLSNGGGVVAAASVDIVYDSTQVDVAPGPDCAINPAIGPGTAADKTLLKSQPGSPAEAKILRLGLINFLNDNIIPDGLLVTCNFVIDAAATAGLKVLRNVPSAADAEGNELAIDGADGIIMVERASGTGMPTPAATGTPPALTQTATAEAPTDTPPTPPAATASPTGTPSSALDALRRDMSAAETTIALVDASGFPSFGTVVIDGERITYTGKSGNDLTGASRGADARPHAAGQPVNLTETAGEVDEDACQIEAGEHRTPAWPLFGALALLWLRRRHC